MRVTARVVDRPLVLRHARYGVGERLLMDPANPQDREALDKGWVRPVEGSPVGDKAMSAPPVDKMVEVAPVAKTPEPVRTGKKGKLAFVARRAGEGCSSGRRIARGRIPGSQDQ